MATANIRATTFNIRMPSGPQITPNMWERQIRQAVSAANNIFGPHYIAFTVINITHLSNEASERFLSEDLRAESQRGYFTYQELQRAERRHGESEYNRPPGSGTRRNYGLLFGGFFLRSEVSATNRSATVEALNILRLNRRPREIATYWVPAMVCNHAGQTMMGPPFMPNISQNNEGIFMPYESRPCILAHEIGHLLMHAGHCSFTGPNGSNEGSAPTDNLMNADVIQPWWNAS